MNNRMDLTIKRYFPEILTGAAIGGTVITALLTHQAAENAQKKALEQNLTGKEKAAAVWVDYLPPVLALILTAGCILGIRNVGRKQIDIFLAALISAKEAHHAYREKVRETIGEEQEKDIDQAVRYRNVPEKTVNGDEAVLVEEAFSGRRFEISIDDLVLAECAANARLAAGGFLSLNDFYDAIGIERSMIGEYYGWSEEAGEKYGYLWLEFGHELEERDGRPCYVLRYVFEPTDDYICRN